jgi:3-hydroxyisobutyrate dehydrogenase-like beta-hydroxyacid dehydrogenase
MTDVSVIGTGRMGAALARAFLGAGYSTCVWNRTAARTQPLADLGAEVAPTAVAAVEASPVVVACVTTYESLREALEPVPDGAFEGHVIVNLTSGTPTEASGMQSLVTGRGGAYLDGHIPVYPRHVGLPETIIMFGGPTDLWEQNQELLLTLGPESIYLGEEIDACNYMAAGVSSFFHVALAGCFESLAYGLSSQRAIDAMLVLIEQRRMLMQDVIAHSVEGITNGTFEADEATIAIQLGAMLSFRETLQGSGQRSLLLDAVVQYLQEAADQGMESLDMGALVKLMHRP